MTSCGTGFPDARAPTIRSWQRFVHRFGDRIELDLRPGVVHWMVTAGGSLLTLVALALATGPVFASLFPAWTLLTLAAFGRLADQRWSKLVIRSDQRCRITDLRGRQHDCQRPDGNFVSARAILLHMNTPAPTDVWILRHRQPDAFRRLARWLQLADARV